MDIIKKGNGTLSSEGRCSSPIIEYCKDTNRSVFMLNAAINYIFCVPTVAINLILFIAVWRTSSIRTPSNILISALASTDSFVGLTAQPFCATLMYSATTNLPSLSVTCFLKTSSRILSNVFSGMSFLIFTAISVDKLLMIHLHLRYNAVVTNKRITCSLVVILATKDYVVKLAAIMFICFIVAFVSYTKIYRTVIRHQKEIHDLSMAVADRGEKEKVLQLARFKKRTFSMMCIYAVFLLFYLPLICSLVLIQILGKHCLILEMRDFALTLVFLNSLVNPVMICWKMREIRGAMKQLVCFLCSKQS